MRKLLFAFCVIILWTLVAQAAIPEMKFRRLDTRNGLSNSQVNCVFRDSKGFVWIGTAYGLNRYDGYRVKVFYSNKRDTTTMRDNYTDQIMEAYDGKLWLKQGMNYSVYDPVTEKVERNAGRELERFFGFNAGVEYVYIDNKKNFWVKFYQQGIYCYNPHTKKVTQIKMGYGLFEFNPTYGISWMTDYGDNVIAATYNGEIICMSEKRCVEWENKWMREHGGLHNQEYKLFVDNGGNIWAVAERRSFVYIWDENRWYDSAVEYLKAKGISDLPDDLQIWYVKVDTRGWIWIATDHQGLIVVDLKNRQWKQFTNSKTDESSICDNTVGYAKSHASPPFFRFRRSDSNVSFPLKPPYNDTPFFNSNE